MKTKTLKRRSVLNRKQKELIFSLSYSAPFMLIFFVFTILPVVVSIFLSFTYFNVLEPPKFIFLDNYLDLFLKDDEFLLAVKNTLVISIVTGPVGYIMSLLFAWFINDLRPRLRAVMVLIFYAPSISGGVFMIWQVMFSGDTYGYANSILNYLGIIDQPVQWLNDPKYMLPIVIMVTIWMSLGAGFLSFVAGLQNVDRSYYEAGYIEGINNRWQELWYITLPSIKAQMMFGAVMSITSSFSAGGVSATLCGNPSTDYAAHTIMNHLDDYGSIRFEMGYASAIATILFVLMVGLNEIVQRALAKLGNT